MTISLTIKAVQDREADTELRAIEDKAAVIIYRALQTLRRDLFRDIDDSNAYELTQRVMRRDMWQPVEDALFRAFTPAIEKGTEIGRLQIERDIFGVVKRTGTGIDWELANEAALRWLAGYIPGLIRDITDTTAAGLRRELDKYVRDGRTVGELRQAIASLFSESRANRIAVTEVTRTFAEGNTASWRESGVTKGRRWNTNRDEIVCPICRPLNDKVVGIDEGFTVTIDNPPAHPNCRCWVSPVVNLEGIE